MLITSELGRPADSKNRIVNEMRARIVGGELRPGSRFPTRSEIARIYGAGTATVQSALDALTNEGFIRVQARRGTFVVDNPPHLARYAVVFVSASGEFKRNRFSTALDSEVRRFRHQRPDLQIAEYYGVDGHEDSEDYQRLVREVRAHRIAGLIFASHPFPMAGTPLLDEPGVPRVALMDATEELPVPIIALDMDSFFVRALDDLQARGCKKIAFLNPTGIYTWQERLLPLLQERGLETRPFWWQCASPGNAETAQLISHLLMRCEERPDALIISNDNLLEYAVAGLVAAGTRVPEELAVVAHCNFPYPTPSALPVRRLGFDARCVLETCIESIDKQRNNEAVPQITNIPSLFEEELVP